MKAEPMRIFLMVKNNLASIDLNENESPFHRIQLLHIAQASLAIILQLLYLVYDAITVREYMCSIFLTTFPILVFISYWNAMFNTTAIYDIIADLEKSVNES